MTARCEYKDLRTFGLLLAAIFCVIGAWPILVHGQPLRIWALLPATGLIALALLAPPALKPIYRVWIRVGHGLGWINTRILLGLIFYGVITPVGLMRRALGRDTMRGGFAADAETYRVVRSPRAPSHVTHQF